MKNAGILFLHSGCEVIKNEILNDVLWRRNTGKPDVISFGLRGDVL